MKSLPPNKLLMRKYGLKEKQLLKIMNECIRWYLSEEELYKFILEFYMKEESKINRRNQR